MIICIFYIFQKSFCVFSNSANVSEVTLSNISEYVNKYSINYLEDNNKIVISCLGLNSQGKLDSGLPNIMKDNIVEYLKEYKPNLWNK